MSDPIVITRELVKRGWSDFEPKLITGLLTGSVTAFVVSLLATYGIHLSGLQENFLSVAGFFLGGYLTPSTGTAVTKRIDSGIREVEQHSGSTVTTVTGPTPIQRTGQTPSFTQVITDDNAAQNVKQDDPDGPTAIIPPYQRGASILSQLPSQQGDH